MVDCQWCGDEIEFEAAFGCNYCSGRFCSDHRLPESHRCVAVTTSDTLGPDIVNLKGDVEAFIGSDPEEGDEIARSMKRSAQRSPNTTETGQGDDCPRCGEPAPKGLTYCTGCRDELVKNARGGDGEAESINEDNGPECSRCGDKVGVGGEYCNSCRKDRYNEKWTESAEYENRDEERSESSLLDEEDIHEEDSSTFRAKLRSLLGLS